MELSKNKIIVLLSYIIVFISAVFVTVFLLSSAGGVNKAINKLSLDVETLNELLEVFDQEFSSNYSSEIYTAQQLQLPSTILSIENVCSTLENEMHELGIKGTTSCGLIVDRDGLAHNNLSTSSSYLIQDGHVIYSYMSPNTHDAFAGKNEVGSIVMDNARIGLREYYILLADDPEVILYVVFIRPWAL